jgi:hypothetical protein
MSGAKWNAWRKRRKDGRWYRQWREPGSRKIHQQIEGRWVWERTHGPISDGYEIHHRDGDHENNDLANLECVTAGWHDDYHQRQREDHTHIDGVEHRRCQRCREYRPLIEFKRRKAGTYQGYCVECSRSYLREWRARNREHHNAYHREYRANRE